MKQKKIENPITVYNFEVEDYHTYFVGDSAILVHNLCRSNYTFNYIKKFTEYTGKAPTGDVHHGLPVKHLEWFESKGINIHDGKYYFDLPKELHLYKDGYGVHTNSSHAGMTWDAAWNKFVDENYEDANVEKIERFLDELAKEFHISEYRAVKAGG